MTIEYVRYTLTHHSAQDLIDAYSSASEHLMSAPECLSYELTQCDEDAKIFIFRIHWASSDAHLKGFRSGPHFPPFLALVKPFIAEMEEMRHYSLTQIARVK